MNRKYPKGFTLIELLIVVAIIGILASIAIPNFLSAQIRSKVARAQADLTNICAAMELYRVDNNNYPYFYLCRWETNSSPPPVKEYGSWEQNRYELKVITTPCSYMGGIPQDIFSPGICSGIMYDGADRETGYWPYDYTSFKAFSQVNFNMSSKGYVLKSRGPDHHFNGGHNYYLATNGLFSSGDIIRYEGGGMTGGWN